MKQKPLQKENNLYENKYAHIKSILLRGYGIITLKKERTSSISSKELEITEDNRNL